MTTPLILSLSELRQELRTQVNDDRRLERVARAAQAEIEGWCGTLLWRRYQHVWKYGVRQPKPSVYLGLAPVAGVESLTWTPAGTADTATLVEDEDWRLLDEETGKIELLFGANIDTAFGSGYGVGQRKFRKGQLRATITGGWGDRVDPEDTVLDPVAAPYDVQEAVWLQAQYLLDRNEREGGKLLTRQVGIDGGSLSMHRADRLHPGAQELLRRYRRHWR